MGIKSDNLILVTVKDPKTSEKFTVLMVKENLESFMKFLKEKNLNGLEIEWTYYDYFEYFNIYYKPPDKCINFGRIRLIDLITM